MPITFTCPHCQARMTVPDAVAGKRGKCSKCKGVVSVPASTNGAGPSAPGAANSQGEVVRPAAPPPPPEDLDALALSVLGDEPKVEEKPTDFVEFNCPQCDEPLKLPRDLAGKKHPCPECRRIISVPIPKKKDPANWRDTGPNLPSGARRDTEPAPEGAWGKATTISDETAQEAGLIPEKHKPATLLQRAFPFLVLGSPLVLLVGGGVWLWVWMNQVTEKRAYDHAVAFVSSDKAASLVGNEGLAALYANFGEYQQKSGRSGSAERARDEYSSAIVRAEKAGDRPERDALLLDLLPTILSLGGSRAEVEAGGKRPIAEVQKVLVKALRTVGDPEARLEGVRRLAVLLIERKDAGRIRDVTMQVYPSVEGESATDRAADRAEALAVVGLELLRAGNKELAADVAKDALAAIVGPKGKKQPALRAPIVALALATDQTPPKPGKALDIEGQGAYRVGRAGGLARKGQADEARKVAGEAENADARFRALVAIAEATGEASDINAALDAKVPNKSDLRWPALRLVALAQQSKLESERQEAAANAVPGGLSGWAHLWLLRARLAGSRSAEGLEVLEKKFPAQSLAEKVARLELSRHNTRHSSGWQKNVKDWDEGPKAFGMLGAALGMQGK